ncbi:MAG: hypothetical protein P8O06_00210 [Porticoccaceae bacterium]|nr:hypothetical protein [Porticoccaceae bacterium]
MKEQRNKNNIGLIGLAVVMMVSLVFYYLVNADNQNNRGNKTNKSHESSVNVNPSTLPMGVTDEISSSISEESIPMSAGPAIDELSGKAIDYGSLKSVLAAFHQESQELLQAYQQQETDMDDFENRTKISHWRMNCHTSLYFDSQAELDRHLASRPLNEMSSLRHKGIMRTAGECNALRNYLGHEEITNYDRVLELSDLVLQPNSEGETHPVQSLTVHAEAGGLVPFDEVVKRFTKAHNYAVDYPEYLDNVFSMAESYLKEARSYPVNVDLEKKYKEAFKLLRWRYYSKSYVGASFMSREEANQGALEVFQLNNHPQEFDEIIELADEIENSVGQGDWSWLNALDKAR